MKVKREQFEKKVFKANFLRNLSFFNEITFKLKVQVCTNQKKRTNDIFFKKREQSFIVMQIGGSH